MALKSDQFVFGIHIYRSPSLPLQELKRDMHTLKKLGFNTVKIQESWAIDERREGEIDLSEVEELIAEAMRELFGVEHENLALCGEWGGSRWTPQEKYYGQILPPTLLNGTGPYQGHALRASLYLETYRPTKGIPILLCDRGVAGVMNEYKRGKGMLVGTFVGHAVATYDHAQSRAFMLKLLADAGGEPENCGRLLRRRRVGETEEAWFLINDSADPVTEEVEVAGFARVEDLLEGKALDIKRNSITVAVEPFSVHCLVLSRKL